MKKEFIKKKRMASLLSLMTFDKSPDDPVPQLPLKPLTSVDDSIYPQTFDSDTNLVPEYQDLWNQFQQDWIENPYRSFESTLAYLDSLYERYFWCVPANTTELIPDSSLYEHSKVSAALAAVLYQYHQAMQTFTVSDIKNKEIPKFLLLVGDLSGIQKFIFQISHLGGGKVAKQLRARSFLLEMIVQIISRKILCKLDLPFFNMIRNAGGKFYLLLPNLPESHQVIDDLSRESQEWLHRNFYGDISLNIAAIPLCGNDFFNKKIGEKFEELSDRLLWAKYSPLKRFLSDGEGWLEDNFIVEDALIQEEAASGIYETPSPIDDEKLGTELARTKCLAIYADRRGDHPMLDWSFSVRSSVEEYDPNAHCLLSFKRGKERSYSDKNIPVHYEYKATYVPTYESTVFPEIDEFQQTHPEEILFPGQVLPFTAMAQIASGPKYVASHKFEHVSVIPA